MKSRKNWGCISPAGRNNGKGNPEYSYTMGEHNVPQLDGSMVFFNCDIVGSHVYGDHTIYVGEVKEMDQQPTRTRTR